MNEERENAQGLFVTAEALRALALETAREAARELTGKPADADRIEAHLETIEAKVSSIQQSLAKGDDRMDGMDSRLEDHGGRLETVERLASAAGLEDIVGVRKLIYRLGILALVALAGLLVVLSIAAPTLIGLLKK